MPEEKKLKFGLGADPEFNIEFDNKKLHAQQTIAEVLKNHKKFTVSERGGFELAKHGNLGWDGHSATAEMRPNAANTPAGLVKNIGEILKEFNKTAPCFELSTLCRTGTIGGHIHFEIDAENCNSRQQQAIHRRMISFYLPIIMGECKINLNIRIKGGYGGLCGASTAYRVERKFTKPNGNSGYTYELRCPSAEWMTTEKIARSTLAYLAVIYNEIIYHPKKLEKNCKDIILRTDAQGNALQTLALCEYSALTKGIFKSIKKHVQTFELYKQYKEECDYILTPEKVLADKQAVNYDMRLGWGFQTKEKEASKRIILSDKSVKKASKEKDLDTISKFVKIAYNDDMNVEAFAKAISTRVAAFNWKLENNYFLYGLKKGIKNYFISDLTGQIIVGKEGIKTTSDMNAVKTLMDKMNTKAQQYLRNYGGITNKLNFQTGKIEKIQTKLILIGIPYQDRMDTNTKKLIEYVYNLDKGKIQATNEKGEQLEDDSQKPEEEKGETYKMLTNQEERAREIAQNAARIEVSTSAETNMMAEIQEQDHETNELMARSTETEEEINGITPTMLIEDEIEEIHNELNQATITAEGISRHIERYQNSSVNTPNEVPIVEATGSINRLSEF